MIVPSLPGYGFSEPPRNPGWDVPRIARAFIELMARLGYGRYVAQGGDWGAQVTTWIGGLDPEHCAAIHLNMAPGIPPETPGTLTEEEQSDLAAMKQFAAEESGYASEQGTKPQTVGVALNDSPAGLLAWIVEKFRAWSDCDGDPEQCFTREQLITNVMLYWVTQTTRPRPASTGRPGASSADGPPPFVTVPTGVARYPKEVLRWPRSWVERQYNVVTGAHGAGWSLPGHGAARAVRRRSASLLPDGGLNRPPTGQTRVGRTPGSHSSSSCRSSVGIREPLTRT